MDASDDEVLESDLPLVRGTFSSTSRVLVLAFGAFVMGMPIWELGPGLWPPNIATPVFGAIILGASGIGIRLIVGAMSGWGEVWRYPPGAIVVERRAWSRDVTTTLTAADIATISVRWLDTEDDAPEWQVIIVPRLTFSGFSPTPLPGGVLDAGRYGSEAYATRVRDALLAHLGMDAAANEN